eukprot:15341713-Ditylum_brightwellii.AAC.1
MASMGRGKGEGKETSQMQSRVDPPEKGTNPAMNDDKNGNKYKSKAKQVNEDNADTDMDLVYDNGNDDDEHGINDEMNEHKTEEDFTTTEDGQKLESSVGMLSVGSRRNNDGGVGTVGDIGNANLVNSSSSSSSVNSFELGCTYILSTTASKLLPPPPVTWRTYLLLQVPTMTRTTMMQHQDFNSTKKKKWKIQWWHLLLV